MTSGSSGVPSVTVTIGMRVRRASSSSITLLKSGERCWTTTNAHPVFWGICSNSRSSASSPPAEAPTPTTLVGTRGAVAPSVDGMSDVCTMIGSPPLTRESIQPVPCHLRTCAIGARVAT
jgi:hypothetical protein